MILIFGQVTFKSYLPSKKISLCQTTRWDFFQGLLFGGQNNRVYFTFVWLLIFAPLDNSNLQVSVCPDRAAKMIAVKWL